MFVCLFVCLFQSVCLNLFVSIRLFEIYLFVCLFVRSFVRLFGFILFVFVCCLLLACFCFHLLRLFVLFVWKYFCLHFF